MDPALAWLLDPADPAARAAALVDLLDRPVDDPEVQAARGASVRQGSVARVLEGLRAEADGLFLPKYGATLHRVVALAEMRAPGDEPRLRAALDALLEATAKPDGGLGRRASHLCTTGNLARAALRLDRGEDPRVQRALQWLVDAQMPDGGWHCWPESYTEGTLDAWEALAAFAAVPEPARGPAMRRAIERGVAFLLDRSLGVGDPYAPWSRLHFPRHYYYDVLVGLDLATSLGDPRDPRLGPALDLLRKTRGADGRWRMEAQHPDLLPEADYTPHHLGYDEKVTPLVVEETGAPSRWITLGALRVLRRVDGR